MNELLSENRPPRWSVAVIALGLLIFGIYSATHMVAAGDTWVALACGRHFDNHGVDNVDPFSFNSHKPGPTEETIKNWPGWARALAKPFSLETIQKWHPTGWINQNWLTHLMFYKLAETGGEEYNYNMLVWWKFALYIITAVIVYAIGRVIGAGPMLSLIAACFAVVVGRTFYDIRPAAFSNLLVPAMLLVLALSMYRNIRYIWLLVPILVFWANVHGGYIYALIMLVPFAALNILVRLPRKWTFSLCMIGSWWVLYFLTHQFLTNNYYRIIYEASSNRSYSPPGLLSNTIAGVLIALTIISIAMVFLPQAMKGPYYFFHFFASLALVLTLIFRMHITVPYDRLIPYYEKVSRFFVSSSQVKFFLVVFAAALFIWLLTWRKERLESMTIKQTAEVIAAGIVSFLAMIIFNPFHLTNLTHTFEISVSEHAASWRQVNEWRPAFDWMDPTTNIPNNVGEQEAFAVLCFIAFIVLAVWIFARFMRPRPATKGSRRIQPEPLEEQGLWPKINLPLLIPAALTVYMAISSRRFIAIAGAAACPFIALLIRQIWQMLSVRKKYADNRPSAAAADKQDIVPWAVQKQLHIMSWKVLAVLVIGFGAYVGYKYKVIYLDPWPSDPVRDSIFMRMTASNVKPIDVCDFMNLNKLSGRMFNYWTEGGALAFGQEPLPETGKIPLQLFMDGRAQAAYNHDKYEYWQLIYSGGPAANTARAKGGKPDIEQAGEWIHRELSKPENNVWLAVLPTTESDSFFMRALLRNGNWKTVYLDNAQRMIVNTESHSGKELAQAVLDEQAQFPDEFSKHLSTAALIFESRDFTKASEMYEHAVKSFQMQPCTSSFIVLTSAARMPPFHEKINQILLDYVDNFLKEKNMLRKKSGYLNYLATAINSAEYLAKVRPENAQKYNDMLKEFRREVENISNENVW